jgi:hypothetical protein
MPTLAVGMWRFSGEFNMPTASVGMAPGLSQQKRSKSTCIRRILRRGATLSLLQSQNAIVSRIDDIQYSP